MIRRVRDAIVLLLVAANGHHLLVAVCRYWLARRGYRPRAGAPIRYWR